MPLQQALRHQHRAFTAFFGKRACYPRFKSRHSRQTAHYTRRAFTMPRRGAAAGQDGPPAAVHLVRPDLDVAALDPTMVVVSREPDGRGT